MPTLPQILLALRSMSEPMAALGPTIWLFLTTVLFMVVMSTRLPAAAPWKAASPPTVSTLPDMFDHWVCAVDWLLVILLPLAVVPVSASLQSAAKAHVP